MGFNRLLAGFLWLTFSIIALGHVMVSKPSLLESILLLGISFLLGILCCLIGVIAEAVKVIQDKDQPKS